MHTNSQIAANSICLKYTPCMRMICYFFFFFFSFSSSASKTSFSFRSRYTIFHAFTWTWKWKNLQPPHFNEHELIESLPQQCIETVNFFICYFVHANINGAEKEIEREGEKERETKTESKKSVFIHIFLSIPF